MSYEKTVWADGDVITAQKLNNIEDGVGKAEFEVFMTAQMDITPGYRKCNGCEHPEDFAGTPEECVGKFVKLVNSSSVGYRQVEYTQIVDFYTTSHGVLGILCGNGDRFQYNSYSDVFSYVPNDVIIDDYAAKITYTITNGVKTITETETFVKNNSHAGYLIGKITVEQYEDTTANKINITTSRIVSVESQFATDDYTLENEYIKSFTTSTGTVYTWDTRTNKFVAAFAS